MTELEKLYQSIETLKGLNIPLDRKLILETNTVEKKVIESEIILQLKGHVSSNTPKIKRNFRITIDRINDDINTHLKLQESHVIPYELDIVDYLSQINVLDLKTVSAVQEKIEHLKEQIDTKTLEYGNFCYDFYTSIQNSHLFNIDIIPFTKEDAENINNDENLSEEEKRILIAQGEIPNDWDSIHKAYCKELNIMHDKMKDLHERIRTLEYAKEMNENLDLILKNQ